MNFPPDSVSTGSKGDDRRATPSQSLVAPVASVPSSGVSIWKDGGSVTRRDACYLIGGEAHALPEHQAAKAWRNLSEILMDELASEDVPKFRGLLEAIQRSMAIAIADGLPITDADVSDD
jgi:hypothetical protein